MILRPRWKCEMIKDVGDEDWTEFGEMLRANSRAGGRDYWFWKDKPEREAGAAEEVLTTAGHNVVDLRPRLPGQDPPDCEATIDGQWCGIEVSELLHQGTLEASIRGPEQHFIWQREDL